MSRELKKAQLVLRLRESTKADLKHIAERHNKTITQFIEYIVENHMRKLPN